MATKTVAVQARMGGDWVVTGQVSGHTLVIDQPTSAGGTNTGPNPLEMFFFSLCGCIASIARIAAHQKRIELRGMTVSAKGVMNPDGLMGRETTDLTGFSEIVIEADIDADLSLQEKQAFLDEVCRRCPVHDNIKLASNIRHGVVAEAASR